MNSEKHETHTWQSRIALHYLSSRDQDEDSQDAAESVPLWTITVELARVNHEDY